MPPHPDRTLAAAGAILLYAAIIGFIDNFVRVIAAEAGPWQFHATRTILALALLWAVAVPLNVCRRWRWQGWFCSSRRGS